MATYSFTEKGTPAQLLPVNSKKCFKIKKLLPVTDSEKSHVFRKNQKSG